MAGTRTAPTVNGVPNWIDVTIRVVDAAGELRAVQYRCEDTIVAAEIEALVADFQAATNSSVYEVWVQEVYYSQWQASNAQNEPKQSARSNTIVLAKDDTARTQELVLPAPEIAMFQTGTNLIDTSNALFADWVTEALNVINGGALGSGTYTAIQARYTERRDKNAAVSV